LNFFEAKTIEVLHIDGSHRYEDVRSDFESWFQKLKDDSIVLFHDIAVVNEEFGVSKFWAEIKENYPFTFELTHSSGLGVLFLGAINGRKKEVYEQLIFNDSAAKKYFSDMGELVRAAYIIRDLAAEYLREKNNSENSEVALFTAEEKISNLHKLANEKTLLINELKSSNRSIEIILHDIQNTMSWRLTLPLRKVNAKLFKAYRFFNSLITLIKNMDSSHLCERV